VGQLHTLPNTPLFDICGKRGQLQAWEKLFPKSGTGQVDLELFFQTFYLSPQTFTKFLQRRPPYDLHLVNHAYPRQGMLKIC
jgi:hypothetical protein